MSKINHKPKQIKVNDVGSSRSAAKVSVQTSLDLTPQHERRLHFYSHLSPATLQMPIGRVSRRKGQNIEEVTDLPMQRDRPPEQPKSQLVDQASLSKIDTIAAAGMHDMRVSMDGITPRERSVPEYHLPKRYKVLGKYYGNKVKQLAIMVKDVVLRLLAAMPRPQLKLATAEVKRLMIAMVILAVLIGCGIAAYNMFTGNSESAAPAASSESFERAKSQWECSLQEYEASIGKVNSTKQESSCLNQN